MNKSKKSLLIAITSLSYTIINGVLGLVATRRVIEIFGSDFNGLSSTANQFIIVLFLLEGGFTVAINISLFKPINNNDIYRINSIMSAASEIFKKIGVLTFLVGSVLAFAYAFYVNSEIQYLVIVITFIMLVISTSFNFYFSIQYNILFQSEQKEYILNIIRIISIIFTQGLIIFCTYYFKQMLLIRLVVMTGAILNSVLVIMISKRLHPEISFNQEPDYKSIKGTKDIMVQKITNVVYISAPILVISATAGTIIASVYSVYYGIIAIIKSIFSSILGAPRIGLGLILAENDDKKSYNIFNEYENIVFIGAAILISVTAKLIIPFVVLYTENISDAQYRNELMAYILVAIAFFEFIHVPSGNLIIMSGQFKVGRNIQIISFSILAISMIIGYLVFDIYGIMTAILITAVSLCIMEMGYVRLKIFHNKNKDFFKQLLINTFLVLTLIIVERNLLIETRNWVAWIQLSILLVIFNSILIILVNFVFNRSNVMNIFKRFFNLLKKNKGVV